MHEADFGPGAAAVGPRLERVEEPKTVIIVYDDLKAIWPLKHVERCQPVQQRTIVAKNER